MQALAGILLPSASVFLLLCNDREVLGPWMNPRWLDIVATVILGSLIAGHGSGSPALGGPPGRPTPGPR